MKKLLTSRIFYILLSCILSIIFILSSNVFEREGAKRYMTEYNVERCKVVSAESSGLQPDPYIPTMYIGRQYLTIELLTGDFKGQTFQVENTLSRAFNIYCEEGTTILCNVRMSNNQLDGLDVFGYDRQNMIYSLIFIFVALLLFIGRKQGFYSIFTLVFTLITVIFFMIPLILDGFDPILSAVITSLITTTMSIFIIADVNTKSFSAILGIMIGIVVAGLVSFIAGQYGNLSGLYIENAEEMINLSRDMPIQVPELLFAGIIISSLGAVMDVGMSISSSIFEIKQANSKFSSKQLYKSGMNIGRDIMGTMSNTLILAFTGSSLVLVIIIYLYKLPYLRLINLNVLGVEILQGLSGSIALVLTIPATAYISSKLATREKIPSEKDKVIVKDKINSAKNISKPKK